MYVCMYIWSTRLNHRPEVDYVSTPSPSLTHVILSFLPFSPPPRHAGDKLAVWTGDARNAEHNMKIGRTLKSRLEIPKSISIGFQAHTDTISKSGSTTKNRYTV